MKPIKAEYNGEQVTIVEIVMDDIQTEPTAVFIGNKGGLSYARIHNFTNCHYEDEFIPLDRIGTTR